MKQVQKSVFLFMALIFSGVFAGCGTAAVQAGYWERDQEPSLYIIGGTVLDLRMGFGGIKEGVEGKPGGLAALILLDIPFSLVADVVLLPLTVYQQIDRSLWSESQFVEELLSDPKPGNRARAAKALAWWEPRTELGSSGLQKALGDTSPSVRSSALYALREIQMLKAEDVIERLADEDCDVRSIAAQNAFPCREAIPALILLLSDVEPEVRRSAVWGLAAFGPDASAAIPALLKISTSDPVPWLRRMAEDALDGIEGRVPVHPPARLIPQ